MIRMLEPLARALLLAPLVLGACSAPAPLAGRPARLGIVEDALAGAGPADELAGGLPAAFLAGDAARLDELFAERARLAGAHPQARFSTLLDLSAAGELAAVAAADRALAAALEAGGAVLLDASGETARGLGIEPGSIALVRVSAERLVVAEVMLPDAAPEAEAAALGSQP